MSHCNICHIILYDAFLSQKPLPLHSWPHPSTHPAEAAAGLLGKQGPCLCPQEQCSLLPGLRFPGRSQLGAAGKGGGPASPGLIPLTLPCLHPY
jgi:hypothetical protein